MTSKEELERPRMLKPDRWTILLVHEAFDRNEEKERFFDQAQIDNTAESTEDAVGEPKCSFSKQKSPKFVPHKRLRYALVKSSPGPGPGHSPTFTVVDVPEYLYQNLLCDKAKVLGN